MVISNCHQKGYLNSVCHLLNHSFSLHKHNERGEKCEAFDYDFYHLYPVKTVLSCLFTALLQGQLTVFLPQALIMLIRMSLGLFSASNLSLSLSNYIT